VIRPFGRVVMAYVDGRNDGQRDDGLIDLVRAGVKHLLGGHSVGRRSAAIAANPGR
jgi:hypothetical protein